MREDEGEELARVTGLDKGRGGDVKSLVAGNQREGLKNDTRTKTKAMTLQFSVLLGSDRWGDLRHRVSATVVAKRKTVREIRGRNLSPGKRNGDDYLTCKKCLEGAI